MCSEEEIDTRNPPPGLEKRHSDVLRRTQPMTAYPQTPTRMTPTFADSTVLPPSLEASLVAVLDATPFDYIQDDPLFTQFFTDASANTFSQLGGAITTPLPDDLPPVPANYLNNPIGGTTVPPPPPPDYPLRNAASHLSYP